MKTRRSAPTFPPDDDARVERPSHADSSHIARRRASSAPAHEVGLGEVELVDEAPVRSVPPPIPSLPPPRPTLPSAPRASQPPFRVPIAVQVPRRSWLHRPMMLLVLVGFALAIGAVGALITRPRDAQVDLASLSARTTSALLSAPSAAAPPAAAPPAATNEIPVVDVTKLPRPQTGTVIGAPGHRLWIDGTLAASSQASVACGAHLVQVGSAGTPRTIDVPCGDAVVALP